MDPGLAAIIGVVVGSLLSLVWPLIQWIQKRSALKMSIVFELHRANRLLNDRVAWIQQPVPDDTLKNNPERVVNIEGQNLLLWQSEAVRLPLPFWDKHCVELAGVISSKDFMDLATAVDLLQQFETKDIDMVASYQNPNNDQAKEMARACFFDLQQIQKKLQSQIAKLPNKPDTDDA